MGGDLINIYYTHKVSFDKAMKENKVGRRGGAPRAVWRVCSFRKWLSNRNLQLQGAAGTGVHRSSALGTARRQAWWQESKLRIVSKSYRVLVTGFQEVLKRPLLFFHPPHFNIFEIGMLLIIA